MTRLERHEQIKALKAEGLTFKEIAARLGLAYGTVWAVDKDPSGDKDRIRKAKRSRPCLDCGRRVTNSGSEPPMRCKKCERKRLGTMESRRAQAARFTGRYTRWTDGQLLEALRSVAVDGGVSVNAYRAAYAQAPSGSLPSSPLFSMRFGTWNDAVEAAGLTPGEALRSYERVTAAGCVMALEDCMIDTGHVPTYREYEEWAKRNGAPSGTLLRIRCGGFMAAVDQLLAVQQTAIEEEAA
jgi:DNA-directed RNA polymerase subunit RPC12/RpoP